MIKEIAGGLGCACLNIDLTATAGKRFLVEADFSCIK
jgi:hypothetical protein